HAPREHHVHARDQREDGGGERARHGAGHRCGARGADLRPLLPGRSVAQSRPRGHRPRTGDRAALGGAARRAHHGRLKPRRGQHVHGVAARGGPPPPPPPPPRGGGGRGGGSSPPPGPPPPPGGRPPGRGGGGGRPPRRR